VIEVEVEGQRRAFKPFSEMLFELSLQRHFQMRGEILRVSVALVGQEIR
jgi:hypothetical protein